MWKERNIGSSPGKRSIRLTPANPLRFTLPVIHKAKPRAHPLVILFYGFIGIILAGAILLILPISSKSGEWTGFVDAIFTSTSAVCVTGLVVKDTGSYWSTFGQAVLLVLIQIGGIGFMTMATLLLLVLGRKIGIQARLLISQTVGLSQLGGMVSLIKRIALYTFVIEALGAGILYLRFCVEYPWKTALWQAIFHSISAFNNCGMDILGNNFRSFIDYQKDTTVILTIAILIILGGLGYIIIEDIIRNKRFTRLSVDTRIVLITTGVLLLIGTLFILFAEYTNPATLGPLALPYKLLVSFFHSVVPRTAGFASIDVGRMVVSTVLFTMFLMFIGGASGSTAGGVKVNTFGLLMATVWSSIKGRKHPGVFGREFTIDNISQAITLIVMYLAVAIVAILILSVIEGFGTINLAFEVFSALGTVGLSTGITPGLSTAGEIILIIVMFVGRLGPLTFALALRQRWQPVEYRYPEDIVRIG